MSTSPQISTLELENALWQLLADIREVDITQRAPIISGYATRIEGIK